MERQQVETEIAAVEAALSKELDALTHEHTRRVTSAVRAAERKLLPLRAYALAIDGGAPRGPPDDDSALARLLRSLLAAPDGLHRSHLDAAVTQGGLSLASARKARYLAESQGLASHVGTTWTLTAAGRLHLGEGH